MLTIGLQGQGAAADVLLPPAVGADGWSQLVLERLGELASGSYTPQTFEHGNVDFQLPRGGAVSL